MWHGILGHDDVVDRFRRTLATGRLASTCLFVGPPGVGKRRFAIELAHSLLCTENEEATLEPCGRCESCRMFEAGNHPDLEVLTLPPDKSTLPIELFIGDLAHRNREGLCQRIGLRPFFGRRKVAIIDDADYFGIASANCLLKTLEEPPPSALLILIGTSPSRQLPTIRSRSQVVRFRQLDADTVANILLDTGAITDRSLAVRAAELSEGSVDRAVHFADPALWEFRDQIFAELASRRPSNVRLARAVQAFVDEAGKEAARKRDRLRIVIGFVIDRYRETLMTASSDVANSTLGALDSSLLAAEYIDRNGNLGLIIQQWCEEIAGSVTSTSAPNALTMDHA